MNPKPRPQPKPSSVDVAERGVASMGVRSSGNLCVEDTVWRPGVRFPPPPGTVTGERGIPVRLGSILDQAR